jgi:hypothetical protein
MHAFLSGSATSGKKLASIVLLMIFHDRLYACLTCLLTEKPRAQKSEDHADQRTEHGEPDGDAGN